VVVTLSVSKQAVQKFDVEIFNLKDLNERVREQHQVKISNRHAVLENLDDVDISRAWESITENMKTSATESLDYYEFKQRKP
jgi:hypothetical protein